MTETLKTISPVDGRIYAERPQQTSADIDRALDSALAGQRAWASFSLAARCEILGRAVVLAWTGVKNSGRGRTLSRVGFEQLTRPKSYHFRILP